MMMKIKRTYSTTNYHEHIYYTTLSDFFLYALPFTELNTVKRHMLIINSACEGVNVRDETETKKNFL